MKIEIYTKPTCQSCVITKRWLTENNFTYTEYIIGESITREAVLEKFPTAKVVPIAIVDGQWIGSKEQLLEICYERISNVGDSAA